LRAGYAGSDYTDFVSRVFNPLVAGQSGIVEISKDGVARKIAFSSVNAVSRRFGILVSVPVAEVEAPVTAVQSKINTTFNNQITIYAVAFVVIVVVVSVFVYTLASSVVQPILQLSEICLAILKNDLSSDVARDATSLELKTLLEAFSGMMVCFLCFFFLLLVFSFSLSRFGPPLQISLRFASDSFAKGDLAKSKKVYSDALDLYTHLDNNRGPLLY
jgi:hypothetical protein